ncbi:MAG TPA: hypothetical protein VLC51_11585, partial [Nitrospira sp.]|nr:hypothetical protein [Nitrospira sp.]
TPIVITTGVAHPYESGDEVYITGVRGNSAANGKFFITVVDNNHFSLNGSIGNGGYAGGGTSQMITHGLRAHEEKGRVVMIIRGTGRGQTAKIIDNDETTLTIDGEWVTLPDATSAFIIVDPNWLESVATTAVANADPTQDVVLNVTVSNFLEQVLLVQGFTENADETRESVVADSPFREIYVFGGPGNLVVQHYTMTFNVGVNGVDLEVADDVAPHDYIRNAGTLLNFAASLKIPCVGQSVKFDLILTKFDGSFADTVLKTPLEIPANSTDLVIVDNFIDNPPHLDENDLLTINTVQIGTTQPGQCASIFLKVKKD